MASLPGWDSPKTVEKIHWSFESLETISLAVAIVLELSGVRVASNVAWVALVIADAGRWIYGTREKTLADEAAAAAKLERLRLQGQLARRDIPEKDIDSIVERLAKFAGQSIKILTFPLNEETVWFASAIARVLNRAGWSPVVSPTICTTPLSVLGAGFTLASTADDKSDGAGIELAMAIGPYAGGGGAYLPRTLGDSNPLLELIIQDKARPVTPPEA
jgi:hypothetical protein